MPAVHSPNILHFPLPDGALNAPTQFERELLKFRMAADLMEAGLWGDHREAFTFLVSTRRYPSFYVSLLIDDARQMAVQCVVATEMSDT